jgi:serine kinase of HPr protein (carbohydrate metabolism regulator)
VVARSIKPDDGMLAVAEGAGIPVFRTKQITMKFINKATFALEAMSAPRTSLHASMVDILGIGVVIQGESGIGKSESVLALLEHGYSLVADDISSPPPDVRVIGSAKAMARHLMESVASGSSMSPGCSASAPSASRSASISSSRSSPGAMAPTSIASASTGTLSLLGIQIRTLSSRFGLAATSPA